MLFLNIYLFSISIYKLITNQNIIKTLIYLKLILNSINLNLITFSNLFNNHQLKKNIFTIFIITLTTTKTTIKLSILSSIHHNKKSTHINQSNFLNN